jgi:hypothetical protein
VVHMVPRTDKVWTLPGIGSSPNSAYSHGFWHRWSDYTSGSPDINDHSGAKWHALFQDQVLYDPCASGWASKNDVNDPYHKMVYRSTAGTTWKILAAGPQFFPEDQDVNSIPRLWVPIMDNYVEDPVQMLGAVRIGGPQLGIDDGPFPGRPAVLAFEVPQTGIYQLDLDANAIKIVYQGVDISSPFDVDVIELDADSNGVKVLASQNMDGVAGTGTVTRWLLSQKFKVSAHHMIALRVFGRNANNGIAIKNFTVQLANPTVCGDFGSTLYSDISGAAGVPDCVTNFYDLKKLAEKWLTVEGPFEGADMTGDSKVNFSDFTKMAIYWLVCTDPANPSCFKPWLN